MEHNLAEALVEGKMTEADPHTNINVIRRLSPRYEIRVQTKLDPIVEETKLVRRMIREGDEQYDAYMARSGQSGQSGQNTACDTNDKDAPYSRVNTTNEDGSADG
ncbi:MAG: hypothetical protein K0Q59_3486 [Paenibacillus sp.]|nr:hypothetical protein [Paenibacillus sp.]